MSKFLIKSTAVLMVGQGIALLVPIIAIPVISRSIDIPSFATTMAMLSILQFGYIIGEFGSNIIGSEKVHERGNSLNIGDIGATLLMGRLVVICGYLIFIFVLFPPARIEWTSFILVTLALASYTIQPIWLYTARENFLKLTLQTIAGKISYLLCVLPAIVFFPKPETVFLGVLMGNLVTLILMIRSGTVKESLQFRHISTVGVAKYLKSGVVILISRVFLNFHFFLSVPLIFQMIGEVQAATYAAAETVAKAIRGGMGAASQAAFPYYLKNKSIRGFLSFSITLSILSILVAGLFAYSAPVIHQLIFESQYASFELTMKGLMVLVPISIINQIFGYPAFAVVNKRSFVDYTAGILPSVTLISLTSQYLIFNSLSMFTWISSILIAEIVLLAVRLSTFLFFSRSSVLRRVR